MGEGNIKNESSHGNEPDENLKVKGALQKRGGRHRLERAVEGEIPETVFDPHIVILIRKLSSIQGVRNLPESEADLEKWVEDNPEEANKLDDAIRMVSSEFGYDIAPRDDLESTPENE